MNNESSEAQIRDWATRRRLATAVLERWLALAENDRDALLELAEGLRLRTGQFVTTFELLDEIGVRENCSVAAVLARRDLKRIRDGSGSAPGRARALLEALRAIRFPRLHAASALLAEQIAALRLPSGIRLLLPQNLGSDELRAELTARSGEEFVELIDALASRRAAIGRIADALGGHDEL
jgi:hypothetical protein